MKDLPKKNFLTIDMVCKSKFTKEFPPPAPKAPKNFLTIFLDMPNKTLLIRSQIINFSRKILQKFLIISPKSISKTSHTF